MLHEISINIAKYFTKIFICGIHYSSKSLVR